MKNIRTRLHAGLHRRVTAHPDAGFTLIELLVVVIIIGILAAVAVPVYIGVQQSSHDAAIKSDLSTVKKAEIMYFEKTSLWTTDLSALSEYGYRASNEVTGTTIALVSSTRGNFCVYAGSMGSAPRWHMDGNAAPATGTC